MRPLLALILVTLFSYGSPQDIISNDDKLNSIESKPSVQLDPYIRKALLKALSELEEGESITDSENTDGITPIDTTEIHNTAEDSAISHDGKQSIKIHSFVVNGQSAFDNNTNLAPMMIDSNISILSTTVGNVENQVKATISTQTPLNEIFQAKETGNNFQQGRSLQSTSKPSYQNTISSKEKMTSKPTTTTTTTTTTPKPTHNDDGENIEEVNKQDVQVFKAPLVAAFTVHQDAHGLPKKVIPIYQQTNIEEPLKALATTNIASGVLPPQTVPIEKNNSPPSEFINQQLILQKELEEKQRILEEQLRLLQLQQRQQEELLRKQQYLLQQKEIQRQQQLLFEQEQLKRQQAGLNPQKLHTNQIVNNLQLQIPPKINQQVPKVHQNNEFRPQNNQVSIQPSISIETSNTRNQQQLPNREAVDFLIHLRSQQSQQFPLQENHLPQGISNFLQPNLVQNLHQGADLNQLRVSDDQFRQNHGNRVFRQESGVGNFGLIPNFPRFNTFGPIYTNRFIPVNRQINFNPDSELKQLLAQNGLNGRAHEDLNIVTKVLSLNHGVPVNNVSNRLPFDTRRHVRTPV